MRKSGLQLGDYPNLIAKSTIEKLSKRTHPLGKLPYYDQSTHPESWREEMIASERYKELIDSYSNTFQTPKELISPMEVMMSAGGAMFRATNMESGKRVALCDLAEKIIRDEWNLGYDEVIFDLEIMEPGTIKLPEEMSMETPLTQEEKEEIENDEELLAEVVKRRTINAFSQGASLRALYIFHLYRDDIEKIVPDVIPFYQKALIANDLFYYLISDEDFQQQIQSNDSNNAGYVDLDFSGEVPKIIAKGMNFPILILEMTKGIISLFSVAGLPKKDAKKVIDYTDTIIAELWDIRLFPTMWGNLHGLIDVDDYDIKKLILIELFKKDAESFIEFMSLVEHRPDYAKKEIDSIAKTKRMEIMEYNFNNDDLDGISLSDLGL
jgi:hypothetical protein